MPEKTPTFRNSNASAGEPTVTPWTNSGVGRNGTASAIGRADVQALATGLIPWRTHADSTSRRGQSASPP